MVASSKSPRRPAREFRQLGDGQYQLTVLELGVQLTVDRVRRDRGHELVGELAVACDLAGARAIDGYLSVADFNLSSAQARGTRAKLLAERSECPDIDWHGLVEELCVRTITAERRGTPSRPLHTYPRGRGGADAVLSIDGWPWLRDHAMITFADGGALKSYLALYGAGLLARSGIPVGYADWELSGDEHRDRLARLFGEDDLPTIAYFRCDRPLVDEADRIQREVHRLGLEYLVLDSAGYGTAGPPEAAEEALKYFRAVRQIGVGSHLLAHINRSDNGDQKPFGSAFWHNSARATWFAKQAAPSTDACCLAVGLYNRKSNLTRQHPAVGFQFEFTADDRTRVTRIDIGQVDDLAKQLPVWQRLKTAVSHGPRTVQSLAEELSATIDTIERTVRRKNGLFTRLTGADGVSKIALVERREAS
jgi:hypothetical protein